MTRAPVAEASALEPSVAEAPTLEPLLIEVAAVETLSMAAATAETDGTLDLPVEPAPVEALPTIPQPSDSLAGASEVVSAPAETPLVPIETAYMRAIDPAASAETVPGVDMGPVAAPVEAAAADTAPADVTPALVPLPAVETLPEPEIAVVADASAGVDMGAGEAPTPTEPAPGSPTGTENALRGPATCACPQNLLRVSGIGPVYQQKLYAAGIGTFWQLGDLAGDELRRILGLRGFQKVDVARIQAAALRLAEENGFMCRAWNGSTPDDLDPLAGIGRINAGLLYDAGICTYRALALAAPAQLAQICPPGVGNQPDYVDWIAQARAFSAVQPAAAALDPAPGPADGQQEVSHVG